jgi:hypothetical protein
MSTNTNASVDWVGGTRTKLLAWWLPHAALVAGLLAVVPARTAIWIRRPRLDGRGVHPQCAALRPDAVPFHRAVLTGYDCSGVRARALYRSGRAIRMAGPRCLHYPRRQSLENNTEPSVKTLLVHPDKPERHLQCAAVQQPNASFSVSRPPRRPKGRGARY